MRIVFLILFAASVSSAEIQVCYEAFATCKKECEKSPVRLKEGCSYGCRMAFDSCIRPGGDGVEDTSDGDYFDSSTTEGTEEYIEE